MTIKDFCKRHCNDCSSSLVCPYNDYWDLSLDKLNDKDNDRSQEQLLKQLEYFRRMLMSEK